MSMTGVLKPVTALLLATAILMLGAGLQGVLLPLRAQIDGFTDVHIGIIGSAYFLGQLGGCLFAPNIISRVGHIRAFAAFTAIASTTPLIHAMSADAIVWFVLRLINGAAFAGILLVIESWLAAASEQETRGSVLGAYTLVHLTVVMAGMQLIALQSPAEFQLFSVVAVLFSLAALPIALTAAIAPVPPKRAKMRLGWLFYISPAAWTAAFLSGFINGAFWMMAPVYAKSTGMSASDIALFIASGVLAGAIAQWPVGTLSDRFGRRSFLAILSLASAAAAIGLVVTDARQIEMLFVFIAVFGAANFPIYILALAHANDLVNKRRAVEVASSLLLIFSIGAVLGPIAASISMDAFGASAMFGTTALAHLVIASVVVVRGRIRPEIPESNKEDFVLVPRTTPAIYEMDPRTDPVAEFPAPNQPEPPPLAPADVPDAEQKAANPVA